MNSSSETPAAAVESLGLIGLGLLGSALGQRLIDFGIEVIGFDIDPDARDRFAARGGRIATGMESLRTCQRMILCLPDSTVSTSVISRLTGMLKPGDAIIDTTTGSPDDAESAANILAEQQVEYLDATVGGSSSQAREGNATIMCGATDQGFRQCQPILRILGRPIYHVGPPGHGSRMKLVTNLVLGLNRAVLAEGLAFAEALDLDPETALEILKAGPAASMVMTTKGSRMVSRRFAPEARLKQHAKDVDLILAAAGRAGLHLPLSELHASLLQRLISNGDGDLDNSAIRRAFDTARSGSDD